MSPHKKPVGLFGGTFDPIHNGHLSIALQAVNELQLEMMQFIPNNAPPLKDHSHASAQDRLTMTKLAVADYDQLIVNDIEFSRSGTSYTIDTLQALKQIIPKQPLCFLIGGDAFNDFHRWHRWQEILDLAHLIVAARPQHPVLQSEWHQQLLQQHQTQDPQQLGMSNHGQIFFLNISPINISATEIRERIQQGLDVSQHLPASVWHYIQTHHLYQIET